MCVCFFFVGVASFKIKIFLHALNICVLLASPLRSRSGLVCSLLLFGRNMDGRAGKH